MSNVWCRLQKEKEARHARKSNPECKRQTRPLLTRKVAPIYLWLRAAKEGESTRGGGGGGSEATQAEEPQTIRFFSHAGPLKPPLCSAVRAYHQQHEQKTKERRTAGRLSTATRNTGTARAPPATCPPPVRANLSSASACASTKLSQLFLFAWQQSRANQQPKDTTRPTVHVLPIDRIKACVLRLQNYTKVKAREVRSS